jgi:hypothetical protein
MLAMRPPDLRPRQAFGAVGASGGRRAAGAHLPAVPGGIRLGRWARPVRVVRRHAAVDPTRRRGLSRVRTHRESGRLAQLEERRPYKAKVGGSSPSAPTNGSKRLILDAMKRSRHKWYDSVGENALAE